MPYETKEGHYQIDKHTKLCNLKEGLDKSSILYLSQREDVQNFQIALPIFYDNQGFFAAETWELMNEQLFTKGKLFRIYSYGPYEEFSLDFLQHLPALTHLQLDVKAEKVEGYEKLADLKELDQFIYDNELETDVNYLNFVSAKITYLSLGASKKSISLKAVEKFTKLESLAVSAKKKDLASIAKLVDLKSLSLSSLRLNDLSFLYSLKQLESLRIIMGSLADFESLASLHLSSFECFQVKGLEDLGFLKNYEELEELSIDTQPKITQFPDLSHLKHLRRIHLAQLKNLTDFTPLQSIPQLKSCNILHFKHDPDLLIPLLKNNSLEKLNFGTSTQNQIKKMELLKEKYGKK